MRLVLILVVCVSAPVLSMTQRVQAAGPFTLNITSDTHDSNTSDGVCADSNNNCSLRAALEQVNDSGGATTINLASGTYTFCRVFQPTNKAPLSTPPQKWVSQFSLSYRRTPVSSEFFWIPVVTGMTRQNCGHFITQGCTKGVLSASSLVMPIASSRQAGSIGPELQADPMLMTSCGGLAIKTSALSPGKVRLLVTGGLSPMCPFRLISWVVNNSSSSSRSTKLLILCICVSIFFRAGWLAGFAALLSNCADYLGRPC